MTAPREPDPQRLTAAHAAATTFYRGHLLSEPRALAYLRSRGIIPATAHAPPWTLGYAPPGWTQLRDHLHNAGYTDHELLAAGLTTTASNGNLIDVFRNRVIFPIRNPHGHVVAFTGRDLSGRAGTPKYRNTTTTAIYHKSELLYGMAEQLGDDIQPAAVMLVEGPADVIAVARLRQSLDTDQHRQPYVAVAPCGTALTAQQIAALADAVPPGTPLVVAFDPDTAGRAAIEKAYQLVRGWPGPIDGIALPAGTDPADLVAHGRASAAHILDRARRPLADLLVDQRLTRHRLDEIPGRFAALHAAAPLIADAAARDVGHAARLSAHLATRLDLNPLTVFEAIYPPADDADDDPHDPDHVPADAPAPADPPAKEPKPQVGTAQANARLPDPDPVGHQHAHATPPTAPAAIWVQHDPGTGHTAWVLAEGVTDSPGDRVAARLAAEVAGRAAILVGARHAIEVARTAVNTRYAQPGTGRGDAAITVLTSFDGDQPTPGPRPYTIAWAGDITAYGATSRWFAPLTTSHTLRAAAIHRNSPTPIAAGDSALTASVRGGTIDANRIDTPLTQVVLVGRALAHVDPDAIRRAVEWLKPTSAVAQLATLGPPTATLVVQPRPNRAANTPTAVHLARQDLMPTEAAPSTPAPRRAPPALPASPTAHRQVR